MMAFGLFLMICSLFFVSFHDCLSDTEIDGERFVDDFSIVDLPESWAKNSEPINHEEHPVVQTKPRRIKRSSWSLPPNTSTRMILDIIMPIVPLNNTFSALTLDLIYRFVLPTYSQLNTLYSTLGRLDTNELDGDNERSNVIDLEFFEEQRANNERRSIYQHVQGLFENFGFDGQTCLLRAICEMAEAPLVHQGLVGKLIDLIFTPSLLKVPKSMEPYLSSNRIRRDVVNIPELEVLHNPIDDDYTDAYRTGKEGKCWTRYYTCPVSIFKLVNLF